MSRTHKKDYPKKFDSRRFDHTCRSHGRCSYCSRNRQFFDAKARSVLDNQENEWFGYWNYCDPYDASANHIEKLYEKAGLSWRDI